MAKDPRFLHADSEDSDQSGQMPRQIRVFAGHTCHFVGFVMRWLICVNLECMTRAYKLNIILLGKLDICCYMSDRINRA